MCFIFLLFVSAKKLAAQALCFLLNCPWQLLMLENYPESR